MGLVFLYTAYFGLFPAITQRGLLLGTAIFITFATIPMRKGDPIRIYDIVIGLLGSYAVYHFIVIQWDLYMRAGAATLADLWWGAVLLIVILEATRRSLGLPLVAVVSLFSIYGIYGRYMPRIIRHAGVSLDYLISSTAMTTEGVWGKPMGVAATYVVIFLIFTSLLQELGASDIFLNIANAIFGRVRGGPAKVAIFGSAIFATISGSALANVAGTGSFTIPLMKKIGYSPEFAAAVEATASTGGQIMPPIMGIAAFIMADFLGVPYWTIVVSAIIPALFYFTALFVMIDLEAAKNQMSGMSKEQIPRVSRALKEGWLLLIPLVILIYFLGVVRYSPMLAGFWTIISTLVVTSFKKSTRINFEKFANTLDKAIKASSTIAIACAAAGIVINIVNISGLGLSFGSILIEIARGNLTALLFVTAIASIILGMGVPSTAAYIILAILVAPALINLGIFPIPAHLFIFYFAMLSNITPPVALAAYVGAGIANANPIKTALLSTRLGVAGFLVPFMFVHSPAYLMQGSAIKIFIVVISGISGIIALAASLENYLFSPLKIWQRICLLISAFSLIHPSLFINIIGYGLAILVISTNYFFARDLSHSEL